MTVSDSLPPPSVEGDIRLLARLISDLTTNVNEQLRDFHKRIIALEEKVTQLKEGEKR